VISLTQSYEIYCHVHNTQHTPTTQFLGEMCRFRWLWKGWYHKLL